jgi:alpha-galactosidase
VLGSQAVRKINNENWNVFVKPLSNGDYAVGILNLSGKSQKIKISFDSLGLKGKFNGFDVWSKKRFKGLKDLELDVSSHETKVIRLSI